MVNDVSHEKEEAVTAPVQEWWTGGRSSGATDPPSHRTFQGLLTLKGQKSKRGDTSESSNEEIGNGEVRKAKCRKASFLSIKLDSCRSRYLYMWTIHNLSSCWHLAA